MSPLLHRHHKDDRLGHQPREELSGPALRLTVHLADGELFHHGPVYTEIVRRAYHAGLAGASVLHGMEGFGHTSRMIHTARFLEVADRLPLLVVIIDTPERIRAFVPLLREVSPHSLVTVDQVELIAPAEPPAEPPAEARTGDGSPP